METTRRYSMIERALLLVDYFREHPFFAAIIAAIGVAVQYVERMLLFVFGFSLHDPTALTVVSIFKLISIIFGSGVVVITFILKMIDLHEKVKVKFGKKKKDNNWKEK